jgi:DNA gyrase subunit B
MPEIIEKGYLYIAQPPLYRIKKGKSENYLPDDKAFDGYIINAGAEGLTLRGSSKATVLSARELESFLKNVGEAQKIVDVFNRNDLSGELLGTFAARRNFSRETLQSRSGLESACEQASARFKEKNPNIPIAYELKEDKEHGGFVAQFELQTVAGRRSTALDYELVISDEFTQLQTLLARAQIVGEAPYELVETKEPAQPVCSSNDVFGLRSFVMERGRKGLTITRFKGLGEMNPEQLWETTLDPKKRSVLQVRIDDVVEADSLFNLLMGDAVEPRREFIEENALKVRNLDI